MRNAPRGQAVPAPRFHDFPVLSPSGFVRLAYVEWGPEDAEQTVLCVHGLSRNGRDFDMLAQRLAAENVRVVAPDLSGRGRSQWLDSAEEYETQFYLSSMAALIARIGAAEIDWVGSSLGGFLGMHLAAKNGTPIRRFVLNDFGARVSGIALQRIGSYVGHERRFGSLADAEAHLRQVHAPFGPLTDAQWAHIVEHSAIMTDDGKFRLHYDPRIAHHISWPVLLDVTLWDVWEKVACPVLLLRGAQSDLFRASTAQEMTKRGQAAAKGLVKLIEFHDCGHAPSLMLENHMAPVLDFLLADRARTGTTDDLEAIG
jgi:pimeloyl-ACP methyl ester carboxylesterase